MSIAAHALVQNLAGPIACQIHALVHRIEGDLANSGYWYRQAGVAPSAAALSVEDEVRELPERLASRGK
jgi:hypothetical protein